MKVVGRDEEGGRRRGGGYNL